MCKASEGNGRSDALSLGLRFGVYGFGALYLDPKISGLCDQGVLARFPPDPHSFSPTALYPIPCKLIKALPNLSNFKREIGPQHPNPLPT